VSARSPESRRSPTPEGFRFVEVDGVRLRISVRGHGRPVLLITGIGASLDVAEPFERELTARGVQAISFDAPGARYTHRDGQCSFETLVEEFGLGSDPALALVAKVVHGADVSEDADITPQSRGLEAIARGFMDLGVTDQEQLRLELPMYDALYAWAKRQVRGLDE